MYGLHMKMLEPILLVHIYAYIDTSLKLELESIQVIKALRAGPSTIITTKIHRTFGLCEAT